MTSNKRIMKELSDINTTPIEGTSVNPQENDVNIWKVVMEGPANSPYAGGHFKITITLPKEYPFKPPVLAFDTKIYHPNVTNDERGAMCLGLLRADAWKPPNKIAEVLRLVRATLEVPEPDDAVEQSIAQQFKEDRKAFDKIAKEWTVKYAK